jgi:hypothetical protein
MEGRMVNRRLLRWGVFLLALGGVLLLGQAGGLDRELVRQALALWPVAVIAIGASILLRRTPAGLASGVVAAALPGLLVGGLVVSFPDVSAHCRSNPPATFDTQQGTFTGFANVELTVACGDLSVATAGGNDWTARLGQSSRTAPTVDVGPGQLQISTASRKIWLGAPGDGDTIEVTLPTSPQLELDARVEAGEGRLDLRGARLSRTTLIVNAGKATMDLRDASLVRLAVEVNAGDADIRLPVADFNGSVEVNGGEVRICVPAELGLRIRNDVSLGSVSHPGFRAARAGSGWESPGYEAAAHHAEVSVDVNVGRVAFNPPGGCQ